MKVYTLNDSSNYTYPIDMAEILNYLNSRGTLHIKGTTVESLYREFCDERYSAGWLTISSQVLQEFAEWLNEYEL